MALADQLRKYRRLRGLSMSELARQAQVSRGYISQLEKNVDSAHPSADVLYRIAFALGTSVGELLEKKIMRTDNELPDIPEELRTFALTEHLSDKEIKMLVRIEYRGLQPSTVEAWSFLYQAIRRSVLKDE